MSDIWENAEIKEKLLRLPPEMQEAFLRSIDRLYKRESQLMLNFIGESRWELRDTQDEIEKEQAVLRDTSDLLASKRFFASEDGSEEFKDKSYEELAVQNYLRSKAKTDGSRLTHTASIIEEILDDSPKTKSHHRRARPADRPARKESPTLAWVESEESGRTARRRDAAGGEAAVGKAARKKATAAHERSADKDYEASSRAEEKNRRAPRHSAVEQANVAGDQEPSSSRRRAEVRDSRTSIESATPRTLEEESEQMVRQYMERDKSSVDSERLKQDEMMKQRREQKKTKHADMAEQLMLQAKLHEEASNKDKEAIEQKMKERLEQRRRRDGLSSADTQLAGVHGSVVSDRGLTDGETQLLDGGGDGTGSQSLKPEGDTSKRRKPKKAATQRHVEQQEDATAAAPAADQGEGADDESGGARRKKKKKKGDTADVDRSAMATEGGGGDGGDDGGAPAEELAEEVQDKPRGRRARKSKIDAAVADDSRHEDDVSAATPADDDRRQKKKSSKIKSAPSDDAPVEPALEEADTAGGAQKKKGKKSTKQVPDAPWSGAVADDAVDETATPNETEGTRPKQQRRKKKKEPTEAIAAEDQIAVGAVEESAAAEARDGDEAAGRRKKKKKQRQIAEAAAEEEEANPMSGELETAAAAEDQDADAVERQRQKNRRSRSRKPAAEGDELGDELPGVHQSREDDGDKKRHKKKKDTPTASKIASEDGEQEYVQQEFDQVAYDGNEALDHEDPTKKQKKKKRERTTEE